MIKLKRIYEKASTEDGYRILVDRLWPRGLTKAGARVSLWAKDIAPSDDLRKWSSHDPEKWEQFQKRYTQELSEKRERLREIKKIKKKERIVTLLYSSKDDKHNNGRVLYHLLRTTSKNR